MKEQLSACISQWELDPKITFLNHGSFGACPRSILQFQSQLRTKMEREPVKFLARELEGLLDEARVALAGFIGADSHNLCFVPNATTGINTVLRSLELKANDELLVTDHEYNASRNALNFVAQRSQAKVIVAKIPFPLNSSEEIIEAVIENISSRTKLVLLDHITSPTGIIFPIQKLVNILSAKGIDTLIDGAHAPGMLPLKLQEIGGSYYTGNCHKWMCAPKGAAFLFVREDKKHLIRPLTISHGANRESKDRDRFRLEFDWTGTDDPTPYLCVPLAINFLNSLVAGGANILMKKNHNLAIEARKKLCDLLAISPPTPDELIGSLVSIPLPKYTNYSAENDTLQARLYSRYSLEVPIIPWPALSARLIRVSAFAYNSLSQYEYQARSLLELLTEETIDNN